MSPHRAGFTRSYSHRVIIKKISSNILVPTKTWLPNRVYIFNTTGSPTLCSSPTWFTNIFYSQSGYIKLLVIPKQNHKSSAEHLQKRAYIKITMMQRFIFSIKDKKSYSDIIYHKHVHTLHTLSHIQVSHLF